MLLQVKGSITSGQEGISLNTLFLLIQHEFACHYFSYVAGRSVSASARKGKQNGRLHNALNKQPIIRTCQRKRKQKVLEKKSYRQEEKEEKSGNVK